jgi:hypothetical protein
MATRNSLGYPTGPNFVIVNHKEFAQMKYCSLLLLLLLTFSPKVSYCQEYPSDYEEEDGGSFPFYKPEGRVTVPAKEKMLNLGAVYVFQWAFYLYSQQETIEEHGSFHNYYNNALGPRFDKDSFEYNIFKHSLVGNYYYLFYRSRGYTEKNAFFWSFMSSLAFEFAIETATEKPSYQDIYQTPVFGMVLGIGFEKLSFYFHEWETWYGSVLGYIVNPMTLIPQFARDKPGQVSAMPIINKDTAGAVVTYRF